MLSKGHSSALLGTIDFKSCEHIVGGPAHIYLCHKRVNIQNIMNEIGSRCFENPSQSNMPCANNHYSQPVSLEDRRRRRGLGRESNPTLNSQETVFSFQSGTSNNTASKTPAKTMSDSNIIHSLSSTCSQLRRELWDFAESRGHGRSCASRPVFLSYSQRLAQ